MTKWASRKSGKWMFKKSDKWFPITIYFMDGTKKNLSIQRCWWEAHHFAVFGSGRLNRFDIHTITSVSGLMYPDDFRVVDTLEDYYTPRLVYDDDASAEII